MAKPRELQLKILWIWNCNEAEIAQDFKLEGDEENYQVKEASTRAFDEKGKLRVCKANDLKSTYFLDPEEVIFVDAMAPIDQIQMYWKDKGGSKAFDEMLSRSLVEKAESLPDEELPEKKIVREDVELTGKQVMDLSLEIEFLLTMQKSIKGQLEEKQIEDFIQICTQGFVEASVERIREELKRRKVIV